MSDREDAKSDVQTPDTKMKALEWTVQKRHGFDIHVGRGLGLVYEAANKVHSPGWIVTLGSHEVIHDGSESDEETAKAVAQADFESRLLSYLPTQRGAPAAIHAILKKRLETNRLREGHLAYVSREISALSACRAADDPSEARRGATAYRDADLRSEDAVEHTASAEAEVRRSTRDDDRLADAIVDAEAALVEMQERLEKIRRSPAIDGLSLAVATALVNLFGDEETDMTVQFIQDGHSGPGFYAWCTEYAEDGSEYLGPASEFSRRADVSTQESGAALAGKEARP